MTGAVALTETIHLPATARAARASLDDVPAVIACIPGATVTARNGDGTYAASIGVQYGETGVRLSGTVVVASAADDELVVEARGQDGIGSVRAEGRIRVKLSAEGEGSRAEVAAEFTFGGVLAPLARSATRIAGPQLLRSFGQCLARRVSAV